MKVVEEGVQTKVVSDFDKTVQTKGKTVPPLTHTTVVEQQEPLKPLTGWRQKFFGIPVWLYLGIGLFIGLIAAIVAIAR